MCRWLAAAKSAALAGSLRSGGRVSLRSEGGGARACGCWDGSRLKDWGGYIMYPPQTVKVDSPHILSYLYRFIELKLQNSLIILPHKHRSVRLFGIGVVNTGA